VLSRVRRWLSVDWEPAPAMAALPDAAALIERGGGRLLRGSSFYEDFVKTVLTINANWSGTRRMAQALVVEPGEGGFPGPEALLNYGEERLRERAKLGFRAHTVIAATRQMLDDGAITAAGDGEPDRLQHEYLVRLNGIGPYAAAHCRVLLHDFSRIPVDSSVVAYLRERYGCDPIEFAAQRASWGGHLALGYRLARLREKLDQAGPTKLGD
jgi:3-methyladenine DNA glycosylase/8-oxoguanine DNA glycosylase